MIAEIGFMIGLYIITRMLSFITRTGERREHSLVIILAGITILITALIMIHLFFGGIPGLEDIG